MASRSPHIAAALLALALALAVSAAAEAQQAVASSVKGDVTTASGGRLTSGAIVRQGETITTAAASSANVVTRDRANVTVGASSSATVVSTSAGNAALNVSQGAFRFVSGSANDRSTIRTPLATVGVRGTIIEGYISRNPPREVFVLIEGAMEVYANLTGQCVLVAQPGTAVSVTLAGINGPFAWTGPTLDLGAGVDFVQLNTDQTLANGREVQPRWLESNEARVIEGGRGTARPIIVRQPYD